MVWKTPKTEKNEMKKLLKLCKEMLEVAESLVNNENEQVERLEKEIKDIKNKIILSEDNAHRGGRPALTDEEIQWIRELRAKGYSQRKTAESVGVSVGSVNKYGKEEMFKNNTNERIDELQPSRIFSNDEKFETKVGEATFV